MDKTGIPLKRYDGPSHYDTIVIGSGIGGLATAAFLAKDRGERVLVLERHYTPGGYTHVFARPGFEWDVGLHYIGEVNDPNSNLRLVFDYVTDGALQWADMGDVYDTVVIGDRRYELVAGKENWRRRMHTYFPEETEAIDRYLALTGEVAAASRGYFAEKAVPAPIAGLLGGRMRKGFVRHADRTTGQVLDELTDNPELKAVLTAQWGDYGLPPAEGSFAMHAIVARHYLEGAAYPVGGSSRIAATIAPVIRRTGGEILIRAEVTGIEVEGGRATGVEMADGRRFTANRIVSDAGVANTVDLLPVGAPGRSALAQTLERIEPSVGHLCLYVGLDGSDAELALRTSNLWVYPGPDHDANVAAWKASREAPLPVTYISFPSAKDPAFADRYPGRATIEIITLAEYDWFAAWEDAPWRNRGEDYEALKRDLTERMLAELYRQVPQVEGRVAVAELSTPLSTRHFANYGRGELYGLSHGPARFRERALKPRTGLKGLLLTGQDICSAGVGGALMGAVLAVSYLARRDVTSGLRKRRRAARAA